MAYRLYQEMEEEKLEVESSWSTNYIHIKMDMDTTYEELNEQIKGCLRALGFQESTIKEE
jgi:hypothetical protein